MTPDNTFDLSFTCENAAFADFPAEEAARILREIADSVAAGNRQGTARDINGNNVGRWTLDLAADDAEDEEDEDAEA